MSESTMAACAVSPHLYEQLGEQITRLIEMGTLRPGERVPSVRRLSAQHQVSISTVTQAYRLLENRGLIEARPQSGYYVRPQRWNPPPEPEIHFPDPEVADLAVGQLIMRVVTDNQYPSLVRLGAMCDNVTYNTTPGPHP